MVVIMRVASCDASDPEVLPRNRDSLPSLTRRAAMRASRFPAATERLPITERATKWGDRGTLNPLRRSRSSGQGRGSLVKLLQTGLILGMCLVSMSPVANDDWTGRNELLDQFVWDLASAEIKTQEVGDGFYVLLESGAILRSPLARSTA